MLISNGFHEMRDVNSVAHNVDKHTANSHYEGCPNRSDAIPVSLVSFELHG